VINTLIADGCPVTRSMLRDFFEGGENFKIIGEAADGQDAIDKILSLNPDLVTLDIELSKKNGFEVIEEAMKKTSVPIVVITNNDSAKNAYEATVKGALEFYSKAVFSASLPAEKRREIYETLRRISGVKSRKKESDAPVLNEEPSREIRAVVIASSTGGPKALAAFFALLPGNFHPPVVIVQHNSSGFDQSFAQWLATHTKLNVKLAEEGEPLKPGTVYVARTDKHLELRRKGAESDDCRFFYNDEAPQHNQKPAADVLFKTAAESLKNALVSVVLTGMGSDGAAGTAAVREMGGVTLAQDEETSFIYGMPKAAAETGCVDKVLPLDKIPAELARLASAMAAAGQ